MSTSTRAEAAVQKNAGMSLRVAGRSLLARFAPIVCLAALAACQQTGGLGGSSTTSAVSSSTTVASASSTTPATLLPGASGASLSQSLAGNNGFANVVDRQGISWSVQIGQAYDSASGKVCKPLRFTSLARAGTFDRIACSDQRGIWNVVTPLQGGEGGPSF